MTIELRQLRYAVLTADAGSFLQAAQRLDIKQSTLSRRIAQLEHRLGIQLFDRSTRGALPTVHGKAFLSVARRIITDIDNLQTTARAISYGQQGRLAVGYSASLLSGPLKLTFVDFWQRFPDVQTDGIEAGPEILLQCMQSRMIDAAIAPSGFQDAGILKRSLWSERLMAVLPKDSPLVKNDRIYWPDLRREVLVIPSGGVGPVLSRIISARLMDQGYHPNILYQDTSLENILSMITARRFISIATEAYQGVSWPDLQFCEIYGTSGPSRMEYSLYWRDDNDNPALKHLFKLLDERYPA
jgi:DNA-binding transcriptional LysR family regulator